MKLINVNKLKKTKVSINKPGKVVFFLHNFSGEFIVDIKSENADVFIFGLYEGSGDEKFSLHTVQHHVVGNSQSNLFVRGVFDDSSKFLYEGLIQIDKKAQKSNAYQKNQNIILSNKVYVDSRPFLEIQANDVRCTHGSTTGRLNTEELFYVQSRGFDIIEAKKLLIQGFKAEVFNQMLNLGVELKQLPYEAQSFS
jgi:Fe-S cluster assembly protein SufD